MFLLFRFGLNSFLSKFVSFLHCYLKFFLKSLNCSFYCLEALRESESTKKWERKSIKNKELNKEKEIELKFEGKKEIELRIENESIQKEKK